MQLGLDTADDRADKDERRSAEGRTVSTVRWGKKLRGDCVFPLGAMSSSSFMVALSMSTFFSELSKKGKRFAIMIASSLASGPARCEPAPSTCLGAKFIWASPTSKEGINRVLDASKCAPCLKENPKAKARDSLCRARWSSHQVKTFVCPGPIVQGDDEELTQVLVDR